MKYVYRHDPIRDNSLFDQIAGKVLEGFDDSGQAVPSLNTQQHEEDGPPLVETRSILSSLMPAVRAGDSAGERLEPVVLVKRIPGWRARQVEVDLVEHVALVGHDDAIREEDRLVDIVGDEEDLGFD